MAVILAYSGHARVRVEALSGVSIAAALRISSFVMARIFSDVSVIVLILPK